MSDRPSLDEIMTMSSHSGAWWRHKPSLRQQAIGAFCGMVLASTVVPPIILTPGWIQWPILFVIGLTFIMTCIQATELVYHRLLGR